MSLHRHSRHSKSKCGQFWEKCKTKLPTFWGKIYYVNMSGKLCKEFQGMKINQCDSLPLKDLTCQPFELILDHISVNTDHYIDLDLDVQYDCEMPKTK